MKLLSILIWLLLTPGAFAQTVSVKSGDHPGFTRLVLELPSAADWKMGRTDEGYELRIAAENLRFDLAGVFDTIKHDRLASIWADPATGGLRLGIACGCYAMPFEFRPGIIVIDLRDGPPPKQSAFEVALDGADAQPLISKPIPRPRTRPLATSTVGSVAQTGTPYDWTTELTSTDANTEVPVTMAPPAFLHEIHDLTPLKETLLLELSKGAAQGVVQMAHPNPASRAAVTPAMIGPRANVHLGEAPGFDATTLRTPDRALLITGVTCIPDGALDIGKWGTDQPIATQLADSRAHLIGEFDRAQPAEVIIATKLLIYLGFGAEARQMLAQFPVDDPNVGLWTSMARLVDGAPDAASPFTGMQTCDTAAALWAAMAMPHYKPSESPQPAPVLRTFSALPAHLRRSLGPALAAKFLEINDVATARALNQAVQRGNADAGAEATVMSAMIDLAAGDPAKATAELQPMVADAGPATAETLIALVDAQLAAGDAIDGKTAIALAALVNEQAGSDLDPALRRAQILALASSGDYDQAFALVAKTPQAEQALWAILAKSGPDTAVLNHAVLPADAVTPNLPEAARTQIASHLLDLGLPDAALAWIGPSSLTTTSDARLIAAKANLLGGNPDEALSWIDGLDDPAASDLRAQALLQLDKPSDAAKAWAQANNSAAELRAESWAGNWTDLAKVDASQFKASAELVTAAANPDVTQAPGPLALGGALVAESAKARAVLDGLLANIPSVQSTP